MDGVCQRIDSRVIDLPFLTSMLHWLVTNYRSVQLELRKTLLSAIWEKGLLIIGASPTPTRPPFLHYPQNNRCMGFSGANMGILRLFKAQISESYSVANS